MRSIIFLCALVLLPSTLSAVEPEDEIRKLAGKDWVIARDQNTLTLIRPKIRVMSLLGWPGPGEDVWKKFSFESDYRITITFATKLSEKEYESLKTVREQLISNRFATRNPLSKNGYSERIDADTILRLPQYFGERHSITVYSSFEYHYVFQPDEIKQTLAGVHALLQETYQKYEQPPVKQQ